MISPEAFDFTSTVSTGSMAPDADADTTRLRRWTGTASYDCVVCVLWQPAMPVSTSAVALARKYLFTSDLPSSHCAGLCHRAGEFGLARSPRCHVGTSPARLSGPSCADRGTCP